MSLNGIGVVDTAHVFACAVVHKTVNVAAAEITMSIVTVTANNSTCCDVFTDDRLWRVFCFNDTGRATMWPSCSTTPIAC